VLVLQTKKDDTLIITRMPKRRWEKAENVSFGNRRVLKRV